VKIIDCVLLKKSFIGIGREKSQDAICRLGVRAVIGIGHK
jgi:hypothetical protein